MKLFFPRLILRFQQNLTFIYEPAKTCRFGTPTWYYRQWKNSHIARRLWAGTSGLLAHLLHVANILNDRPSSSPNYYLPFIRWHRPNFAGEFIHRPLEKAWRTGKQVNSDSRHQRLTPFPVAAPPWWRMSVDNHSLPASIHAQVLITDLSRWSASSSSTLYPWIVSIAKTVMCMRKNSAMRDPIGGISCIWLCTWAYYTHQHQEILFPLRRHIYH